MVTALTKYYSLSFEPNYYDYFILVHRKLSVNSIKQPRIALHFSVYINYYLNYMYISQFIQHDSL